jgi:hypothetical protein
MAQPEWQETPMFRTPVTLIGLAGAAFLAGSLAPDSFTIASPAQSQGSNQKVAVASKADRLSVPVSSAARQAVSVVELVGVTGATVIMRDRNGEILYRSDPQAGITVFSKNTDLPMVTLKDEMQGQTVQHPAIRRESNEAPLQDQAKKRRKLVGCMGDVSPLVRASAERTPSLCLAVLDRSLSRAEA